MLTANIRRKRRGGADVIRDVKLTVSPGETLALVGPSGCGKSSAMKILAGLDLDFEGERVCPAGASLSMAFQEPRLLPWRTVRENVALALPASARRGDRADIVLTAVGLADAGDLFPGQLSLGMARRAALARALAPEPDYLLLDEPFVSLDEPTANRMRDLLTNVLSGVRAGVVLVTHDLREAAALADRVLILSPRPASIVAEHQISAPRAARDQAFCDDARRCWLQT